MSKLIDIRPSLNLQFDSQPTPEDMTSHLASVGATFSRASTATYTDANGIIRQAAVGQARPNYSSEGVHEGLVIEQGKTNFVKNSEILNDSTTWQQFNVTITEEEVVNPKGSSSAFLMRETTDNGSHYLIADNSNTAEVVSGDTYTQSIFVKKGDGASAPDIVQMITHNTNFYQNFNISTGELASGSNIDSAVIEAYGDWYRLSITYTSISDNPTGGFVALTFTNNSPTATRLPSYAGNTNASVYVWGAQFEKDRFPTSYIPTPPAFVSRASQGTYIDSNGVLQTAEIDEPRINHTFVNGEWVETGLLLESAATNYIRYSSAEPSNWFTIQTGGSTSTKTTNQPDLTGGTDAVRWQATCVLGGSSSRAELYHQTSTTAGVTYTFSFYAKSYDGNNYTALIWAQNDKSFSFEVTDTWQRFEYSITVTSIFANFGVALSNSGPSSVADMLLYGFQLEEGTKSTSFIYTNGAIADRAADISSSQTADRSSDVCYIDGAEFASFYNDNEGTIFVNAKTNDALIPSGVFKTPFLLKDNTATYDFTGISFETELGEARIRGNIDNQGGTGGMILGTFTFGDFVKAAEVIDSTANSGVIDGGTVQNDILYPFDLTGIGINSLQIGYYDDNRYLDGSIKKLIYFPRRLPDDQLIKLTRK